MCIMDGTTYDLTTSVFTGFSQPLTGRMQEIREIFWPRWDDCSITFMTWGDGQPAAAADIEIYELDEIAAFDVPGDPGDGSRRELGIQYEDPSGTGASEGAASKEEWVERVIAYMRHSGQKLFAYPIVWYHGPQYPSEREPADAFDFDVVAARDRKQYVRWTTHPPEWIAPMLERFGEEGLEFQATLTLLRLGSLMQKMNIDLEAIKAGADTINNMLWCDEVKAGTGDWTCGLNALDYSRMLEYPSCPRVPPDFPWAYGEKTGQLPPGPIFNPLHPVVQEAIVGLAGEIAQRYARYPAFKGISFNIWHSTILWFFTTKIGYDDYTVGTFEKETGISVPVDAKAPDRFSKRHEFLTSVCRPAWLAWRCLKIRDLIRRIRDAVVAARPDLRVTLTLWDETTVPALVAWQMGAALQFRARPGALDLFREGGLDIRLYRDEPGIELDLGFGLARDWGGHEPASTGGVNRPIEASCMYRDHAFLDKESLLAVAQQRRPGAFVFDCWAEAWGKEHKWFNCEPDDPQARELAVMSGQPAEGICRMNLEYPKDGFWWDSQLRIIPLFPGGEHFLEPYAHAVAELDACRITRGGLFLDKAHSAHIQRFARAYRALPKEKFETVGASADPVAVRTLVCDGRRYFYLVNRDYYPVPVRLIFTRAPGQVTDLATGQARSAGEVWEVVVGPYELRSYAMAADVGVRGFVATPPADVARGLAEDARRAVQAIESVRESGRFIAGMDEMQREIEAAVSSGRLAWLRRALTSYIVRKCRELTGSFNSPPSPGNRIAQKEK